MLVFQDESERRSLMQRLAWQAERDHLTGVFRHVKRYANMALGAEIVDLVGLHLAQHPEYAWQEPLLRDLVDGPWTAFAAAP